MNIDVNHLEKIVIVAIFIVLMFLFRDEKEEVIVYEKPDITFEEFNEYPILAWRDRDNKGDVCKIRYRIERENTKLWIYDYNTGELVHEQPFDRDPPQDGQYKDFTYTWRLYRTERTIDIYPGIFEIIVGGLFEPHSKQGKYTTLIEID
tara:strand:- start:402 stop:848 length:447 start_codon:yes stop_codon:yes gene_type:complete